MYKKREWAVTARIVNKLEQLDNILDLAPPYTVLPTQSIVDCMLLPDQKLAVYIRSMFRKYAKETRFVSKNPAELWEKLPEVKIEMMRQWCCHEQLVLLTQDELRSELLRKISNRDTVIPS